MIDTAGMAGTGMPVGRELAKSHGIDTVRALILCLIAIIPFDGFQKLPTIFGTTFVALAGYIVFAAALSRINIILSIQGKTLHLLAIAYLIGSLIAFVYFLDGSRPIDHELFTSWQMLALFALVVYLVESSGQWDKAVKVLIVSMLASFAIYLLLYAIGFEVDESETQLRARKVFGYETNHISHACAMGTVLFAATLTNWTKIWKYVIAIIGVLIAGSVMIVSNSKGGFLVLLVGVAAILMTSMKGKGQRRRRNILLLCVIGAVIYLIIGTTGRNEISERFTSRWDESEGISQITTGRSDIMLAGAGLALSNPIGFGIGNSKNELGRRVKIFNMIQLDAQNEYLRIVLDCGWIGLIVYLYAFYVLLRKAWVEYRSGGETWPLVALIAVMTSFMSLTTSYDKITWVLLGLIAGALKVFERKRAHRHVLVSLS